MIAVGFAAAAVIGNPSVKMLCFAVAAFGIFSALPVFWTLPTAFLSGTAAAAGIAAVNSIGNLGGYFAPQVFGILKDATQSDFTGLVFLAASALIAAILTWVMGHNPMPERAVGRRREPAVIQAGSN
jgi:ACS family tartrate transporter-like MFS transporter